MAKLQQIKQEQVKRLLLPSNTPDNEAWVDIKVAIPTEIVVEMNLNASRYMAEGDKKSATKMAFFSTIASLITDWSFFQDSGEKEEINADNVRRLDSNDFTFLLSNIEGLSNTKLDVKKNES